MAMAPHGEPADRHVAVVAQRLDHLRNENQHAQAGGDDAEMRGYDRCADYRSNMGGVVRQVAAGA
jgi:hypothetical protein